nr:laminin subunit beta-4 [Columba livia]XP_021156365.1 laminin subunit beta-4 [Columba livia]XP_021156412.1 laminin subunit beta-4 [Columba livia]XP_021156468.1 laminin subunit beta-4 [Columba livia]XP_021156515.1 laminin subunit beta-4 [Columba livia]XP_021156557.1 laminin subunit beta-4 [Columba livia]
MRLGLAILLHLMLVRLQHAQDDCDAGSCHPAIGDLLLGRSKQLTASSTCGMNSPQKYCIIGYLEDEQKCFLCDSRYPYNPYTQHNSHMVENVITTFEPDRKKKWWQSENGVNHVSIRLDLETLFQFSHLILTFKTFRPAAMLVERSTDFGQTWKAFRYFAQDCTASFPNIPSGPAKSVGDIICDSRYSDIEPSTEGEVVLKALDPSFEIENPYVPHIQELITLTNLRINFTKLHTLGDALLGRRHSDPLEKYYYAVYEMVVRGSCFCNGHASRCAPVQNLRGDVFHQSGMVHGRCICHHNTEGLSCERCKDFYNDVPWRPAEGAQDNACKRCNCNGHSGRCHFDMAVYQTSGGVSGGVCEDCQDNTTGQHCDQCQRFFYRDPLKVISDPHACLPCNCDPEGTLHNGMCESRTDPALGTVAGRCPCKENVEGVRCDKCRANYYGLSGSDPLGCQPCNCDPAGSLPFSICDPATGECLCQRFATGQRCEKCLVGYWGLGNSLHGCSPCDCDIGGSQNNLCSPKDGQCKCLPNIVSRQCNEPAPGYFFLPLDYYIYEAEHAKPLSGSAPLVKPSTLPRCDIYFQKQGYEFMIENGKIVLNRSKKRSVRKSGMEQGAAQLGQDSAVSVVFRQPSTGRSVTWTGPGFSRVPSGAGLRFAINNIPFAMDFDITIRYEPESLEDWIASVAIQPAGISSSQHCKNKSLSQEPHLLPLSAAKRIALLQTPVCLEPGTEYSVDVYFSQPSASDPKVKSFILIDSLGLIPRISSVENLCSEKDLDEYQKYHCIEIASEVGPHVLPEACTRLIVSMSARIHNGAIACKCNPQGSLSASCSKLGGQCQCKANVVGRCCDTCSAGSYGFGFHGCYACECHPQGSLSTLCDQVTGQCSCRHEVDGQRCSRCLAGYFGFPHCRPCPCNGYTELCDPVTGACLNCRGFTAGSRCERCVDGYYGNPLKGEACRPCMCPGAPTSNRYFAHSCYQDSQSAQLVCNCLEGYSGDRCDECPSGFYKNPGSPGHGCVLCPCNNNIDVTDPESCNRVTGECTKCLHNTHGANCQFCKPGYFGSALNQDCQRCTCNVAGVHPAMCPGGDAACLCDPVSGACPCLPNVVGATCDQCAPGYWDLASGKGCQICDCDPKNSQSNQCNQFTGQCPCKPGYSGRCCDECEENYFGNSQTHCISCECNPEGTSQPTCDKATGACKCRAGVTGRFCDKCGRGFEKDFPSCHRCHLCFDQWDTEITALAQTVQVLMRFAANLEVKGGRRPSCDMRFKAFEDAISEIERILRHPVLSLETLSDIRDFQGYIQQKVAQMGPLHSPLYEFPDLNKNIEDIGEEADLVYELLQQKIHLHQSFHYLNLQEAMSNIRKHFEVSLLAEQKTSGTTPVVRYSEYTRNHALAMLGRQALKASRVLEQLRSIESHNIQNLNEKICGVPGDQPCVTAACGGALCQDRHGLRQCGGPNCSGALPLSTDAFRKAEETAVLLNNLTTQLRGPENQVKSIRKTAEESKLKGSQFKGQLERAKNQIEVDQEITKEFIRKVKDFLLDESAPPEDTEKVANYILQINLPLTSRELTVMLDKIRSIMKPCEKYKMNASKRKRKWEEAQTLLVEAQEADKAAKALLPVDEMNNKLKNVVKSQGRSKNTLIELHEEIRAIRTQISQAENKVNKTNDELNDLSAKQSEMEDEIATLQAKMLMNKNQAMKARAGAEAAHKQAQNIDNEFADIKRKYTILQEKLKARVPPKVTLEKVKQLKEAAEKLAEETERKIKRITDLEKKLRDLNQTKQDKAEQLRQLEEQVIAIKNEITEQESKYATCKS